MVRETLITKPDIGIHKVFFPVIRLHQGLTGHFLDASVRILSFAEKILEKHNGVRFYDFDFSAFVFLDRLMAEKEQQEQAKKQVDEVRQAISVWNVFEQHMHLFVWNSIDQSYQRVMTLLNHYGSLYPQFFAGDVQVQRRTSVLNRYNAVPYVASRTFHNIVQHLQSGNQIEPASIRIKRDFERQMVFLNWIRDEYRLMSEDMPQVQPARPNIPLSIQRILRLKQSLYDIISERQILSVLYEQFNSEINSEVSKHRFENFEEEKLSFVRMIRNHDDRLENLIYRVSSFTEEQWQSFKVHMGELESQEQQLAENHVDTITEKNIEALAEKEVHRLMSEDMPQVQPARPDIPLSTQRILYLKQSLDDIISERQILSVLYEQFNSEINSEVSKHHFENFEEEKTSFVRMIRNHDDRLENLIFRVSNFTEEQWQSFKVHMRELENQEQQLIELKNRVDTITEKNVKALAVERVLNPEWQEQLSVTGQRILNMMAVLSDIIHEKQTLRTVLQQLDTEFEQLNSTIIRNQWQSFKENVHGETAQIDQLVSLQQYMETISRKPRLLITNEDIHNVARVEDSITRLENNLVHRAWTYNDITSIIRTMQEHRFESLKEEKEFFIDSVKKYSTAVKRKQKIEKLSEEFTEEIKKNLTKYVDLETLVSMVQQYSSQEWREFKEKISQTSVQKSYLKELKKSIEKKGQYSETVVEQNLNRIIDRQNLNIQTEQRQFDSYEEEKNFFINMIQNYGTAIEQKQNLEYGILDNLIFRVQQYTSQEWQEFKENISLARVHEEKLRELKKIIESAVTVRQTEIESRKQWNILDEISAQQRRMLQNVHVPVVDIQKVLNSSSIEKFSVWIRDFKTYKNHFIQYMNECRTENRQLFLGDKSRQQIERVLQSTEGRHIQRLLNMEGLPQETVEFEGIRETLLRSIRRYNRIQWNDLISDIGRYYNTSVSLIFETVNKSVPILRSAVNVQLALADIRKIRNQSTLRQILANQTGVFLEKLQENATAYTQVQRYIHVGENIQEQQKREYMKNIQEQQNRQVSVLVNRLAENQADVSEQNQPDIAAYETVNHMVLREEMSDGDVLMLDAKSGGRFETRQEIIQLAPSVKQSKEKLKQQEVELERLNNVLRENKNQMEKLTKEQLGLKQIIQEQSVVIEQIGTGEAVERLLMNRLQNEMRIERMRRGIR